MDVNERNEYPDWLARQDVPPTPDEIAWARGQQALAEQKAARQMLAQIGGALLVVAANVGGLVLIGLLIHWLAGSR